VRQRNPSAVDVLDGCPAELLEQLDALCHTVGTRRVTFGVIASNVCDIRRSRSPR
jgi:hypothetical protein